SLPTAKRRARVDSMGSRDAEVEIRRMAERLERRRTAAIHGVAALAVLVIFRLREQAGAFPALDLLQLASGLLPAVGILLALEALLLMVGRIPRLGRGRPWAGLLTFGHLIFLVFGVMDHRYFLATGTRMNVDLVLYALRYVGSMGGNPRGGLRPAVFRADFPVPPAPAGGLPRWPKGGGVFRRRGF